MEAFEGKTGGRVLAIAHNGNLSNGIMFPGIESFTGQKVDREYAATRPAGSRSTSDPNQGRWRVPQVPVARRRIRRLRDLG